MPESFQRNRYPWHIPPLLEFTQICSSWFYPFGRKVYAPMQIYLSSGTGTGPTELAAFDAALLDAGVANHNLICLSSVIPPNSVIERTGYIAQPNAYGDRLYVVMARQIEVERGKSAWAGLGWTQNPTCGQGLFVELHGSERAQVVADIEATLTTMIENRPLRFGSIEMELAGIACCRKPVCALVVAVYQRERWADTSPVRRIRHVR
jgi:arginine decarboxylase